MKNTNKGELQNFVDLFFDIEKRHNLFSVEHYGFKYWDVVRYDVFYKIYYKFFGIEISSTNSKMRKNSFTIFQKLTHVIKFYYSSVFIRRKYLFFTASRNINESGLMFDVNLNDCISILKNDSIVIETFSKNEKSLYDCIFDYGLVIENKISITYRQLFPRRKKDRFIVSEILKNEFKIEEDFDELIAESIRNYKVQFKHYIRLFNATQPKAIFVVQYGVQKGMFTAANKLNIPLVEVQHGLFGYYHPSYSYPGFVLKNQLNTLPRYFFTYSDFWTRTINFPVLETYPIGNSFVSGIITKAEVKYEITVLYADGYNKYLLPLIDDLLSSGYKSNMCIKLHPSLFNHHESVVEYFKPYKFIDVIKNEVSVERLLSISKSILVIQSTTVYQALNNKVFVFILKALDFEIHADVFDNQLVCLVDSAPEIIERLEKIKINKDEPGNTFFEDFNEKLFLDFMKVIE